ncbi:sigma 54-interacting transcriptional regulator [Bryobacter aggregatus]|uniref:sigma 54-interacting transcriptional regulator n=1 Tax=Bryobacter aggregatus TaxID=360054 RepID=UPI00068F07E7|nr:sigma-54 dependent transcriptional regulator [Bryobacter aggregatus]
MPEDRFSFLDLDVVFANQASKDLLNKANRLAEIDCSVLIDGESGSGKEILARAIHCASKRSGGPWVDVSCAALPEQLVESELFGYERGAFSGAVSRKEGLFELAQRGTLFLDEIGELPLLLQAKLLRVLESNSYFRLGGTKKISADVRVVAATNRSLRTEVEKGNFREDLYHRLAQLRLQTIPLRERTDDIMAIGRFLLKKQKCSVEIAPDAEALLRAYPWPGNVRELRNCLLQSYAASEGGMVQAQHLPEEVRKYRSSSYSPSATGDLLHLLRSTDDLPLSESIGLSLLTPIQPFDSALAEELPPVGRMEWMERKLILETLRENGGHQEKTANVLGISTRTLSRKLKVYESQQMRGQRRNDQIGA